MSLKTRLQQAVNEKDVENIYRSELLKLDNSKITSPYAVDGLLENKTIRSLLEFKYDKDLKNKLEQTNILIQCLYYLKKFEINGDKLPSTIFVGDTNECFAIHTNSIVKYLSNEINWKIAPSIAHKQNPDLIQAMVNDIDILPFVYDINETFTIKTIIDKIKDFSDNVIKKVRITKHNVVSIFNYFDKHVLTDKTKLKTNEKANLFIQIVINSTENYLHPKKKNILLTKHFGELNVNHSLFQSFFRHFEGDIYSPKEKEELTSLVDRLIDDTIRRSKGEFFTPTPFVDLAHKYISDTFGEDWKEKYIVWDNSAATLNLTRDYKFKELYISTLEQSDLDTAEQMNYNSEAIKFQYDFLNDITFDTPFEKSKVPVQLQDAIRNGKEILFLINPPYATAANSDSTSKEGVAKTQVNLLMLKEHFGSCSQNLYAQFLYKIYKFQEINKNIKIGLFSPALFLTGSSYTKFREKFLNKFEFKNGFLFQASHFSDVATNWGILFSIFDKFTTFKNTFNIDIVDSIDFELTKIGTKILYNVDKSTPANIWCKKEIKGLKTFDVPQMKSALNIKTEGNTMIGKCISNSIGFDFNAGNNIETSMTNVSLLSSANSTGHGFSIIPENFLKVTSLFVARKSIQPNWINCKDEYLAPNESHLFYNQFQYDSIVYSLFNNSSQQSSLRQVEYKNKLWDIKNEFFWLSKNQMLELANDNNYDNLYKDAKTSNERHVYNLLFGTEKIYNKLSIDAKDVLDSATNLLIKSIQMRKILSENKPEYYLDSWDSGYAQLKLVWKEYFKDEFNVFRNKYKEFENRLRPLVYELGFLKE